MPTTPRHRHPGLNRARRAPPTRRACWTSTAAWTRWDHDTTPQIVLVLPDCPATEPNQDRACSEYEGHRGGHTWQVEDPWNTQDPSVTGV